jgi:hypothetical protein
LQLRAKLGFEIDLFLDGAIKKGPFDISGGPFSFHHVDGLFIWGAC